MRKFAKAALLAAAGASLLLAAGAPYVRFR